MNAEKIEVGDVWKNKYDGSLCHIISVKKDEVTLKQLGYLLTLWLILINTGKWLAKQQMKH